MKRATQNEIISSLNYELGLLFQAEILYFFIKSGVSAYDRFSVN